MGLMGSANEVSTETTQALYSRLLIQGELLRARKESGSSVLVDSGTFLKRSALSGAAERPKRYLQLPAQQC